MSSQGFDEFYARTFTKVLSAAILAAGHRGDAEDAVQDAYLVALLRWDRVSGCDAPDAWVLKVAMRLLWRNRRKRRRAEHSLEVTVPPQAAPEETAQASEVLGALAALSPDVRIPIVMCAVLGWPQAEVAEVLAVPRNTIANRIFRGRAMLATRLGLAGPVAGARDALVPTPRLLAQFAVPDDDPVGVLLERTDRWLRASLAAQPETAEAVRERIASRAAAPARRRWHPGRLPGGAREREGEREGEREQPRGGVHDG